MSENSVRLDGIILAGSEWWDIYDVKFSISEAYKDAAYYTDRDKKTEKARETIKNNIATVIEVILNYRFNRERDFEDQQERYKWLKTLCGDLDCWIDDSEEEYQEGYVVNEDWAVGSTRDLKIGDVTVYKKM